MMILRLIKKLLQIGTLSQKRPGLLYCSLNVVVQLIDTIMWVSSLYARYFLVTTQE